ncbi:MAG: WYL domain-containing protein [Tissierellia bacterium]|nr:WYL domain-containing protein [Tissierellia bacterium]
MAGKGLICIYILEILETYASKKNRLTQVKLIEYLRRDYDITVTRKTLSSYLTELKIGGYVAGSKGLYKVGVFNNNELRLLIDGVLFGKHIPKKEAKILIDKLKSFSYYDLRDRFKHVCYLESINRTKNGKLYEIIDAIDLAIEENKVIEVKQCSYDLNGNIVERGTRKLHPYYLITEKCMYYLICYSGRNSDLENRRIDRICDVKILDENRRSIRSFEKYKNGFDLGKYMSEHIYMFSGDSDIIRIKINISGLQDFIDWFGVKYYIEKKYDDHCIIRTYANTKAIYYWALQYGEIAEIISPKYLRENLKTGLSEMLKKYK